MLIKLWLFSKWVCKNRCMNVLFQQQTELIPHSIFLSACTHGNNQLSCIFYFPYHIRMYMHGSVYCIIALYCFQFNVLFIFLNLCILQNSIFDEPELIVLSSLLDWPLNNTSQNVWHIQPCVYMTCSYETQCTAKGSVIALERGMFFVFIQKLKSKRPFISHIFNGPATCRSISTSEPGVPSGISEWFLE